MRPKIKDPAGSGLPSGAENIIRAERRGASQPSTTGALAHPVINYLRQGPGGKAEWLVLLAGYDGELPMRDRKLRSYRRFRNVMRFRFGVEYAPMAQTAWSEVLDAAMRPLREQ
jgi:hypothetical protein